MRKPASALLLLTLALPLGGSNCELLDLPPISGPDGGSSGEEDRLDRQSVIDACMLAAACNIQNGYSPEPGLCAQKHLETLVDEMASAADQQRARLFMRCGQSEDSCEGLASCLRGGVPADYCATHAGGGCEGDLLISCGSNGTSPTDCALFGNVCVELSSGAVCATGESCDTDTGVSFCSGDFGAQCNEGHVVQQGCGFPGTTCVDEGNGVDCVAKSSEACEATQPVCDGDRLVTCIPLEGGSTTVYKDCGAIGMACDETVRNCEQAATECDSSDQSTCTDDGAGFQACVHGTSVSFACADIGRTTCTYSPGHASCE